MHSLSLSFTQDDSFISYRYVKNFLDGHGLVYNPGERVEGYTNFLLVITMIFSGLLGLNYILISKIIGVGAGAVIIFIAGHWSEKLLDKDSPPGIIFLAPLLLAANTAFAYWAVSGLETTLFAALVFAGLYLASRNKILFAPILALATLTRPEGGLIFLITVLYRLFIRRRDWKESAAAVVIYVLMVLPQFVFRLHYYGDLLPNPFYAKTGWSWEYFRSGIEYVGLFLTQYGFWGLLIIIPMAAAKILKPELRFLLVISIIYMIYITMVGGDVLYGHRFFIALLAPIYLAFALALSALWRKLPGRIRNLKYVIILPALLIAVFATFYFPRDKMLNIRRMELALVDKMRKIANYMADHRRSRFTIACSTIGAMGYYSKADLIDMLGLTDRTIAHHPQPLPGVISGWKERNYNIPYLMSRAPDFILFSTGMKPSAPAEKALFLSSKFRNGYFPIFFDTPDANVVFKIKPDYSGPDIYSEDGRFIDALTDAIYYHYNKRYDLSYEAARKSLELSPPGFYLPLVIMGDTQMKMNNMKQGISFMEQAFEISGGFALPAASRLAAYYWAAGDTTQALMYKKEFDTYNRLE